MNRRSIVSRGGSDAAHHVSAHEMMTNVRDPDPWAVGNTVTDQEEEESEGEQRFDLPSGVFVLRKDRDGVAVLKIEDDGAETLVARVPAGNQYRLEEGSDGGLHITGVPEESDDPDEPSGPLSYSGGRDHAGALVRYGQRAALTHRQQIRMEPAPVRTLADVSRAARALWKGTST